MQSNFIKSKKLIIKLGYKAELYKVNLINKDDQYVVDYEPCNFLRGVIETGITKNLVDICGAFNTFASGENHPFTKFIETTHLYGDALTNTTPDKIIEDYSRWFELNKNNFVEWC